jgi:hypothetical protein
VGLGAFNAFGATLMPILAEQGVEVGQPDVSPIHNVVVGASARLV